MSLPPKVCRHQAPYKMIGARYEDSETNQGFKSQSRDGGSDEVMIKLVQEPGRPPHPVPLRQGRTTGQTGLRHVLQ